MGVTQVFETTWGTHRNPNGGTRFRLWAPACAGVSVRTCKGDVGLEPVGGGWFENEIPAVAAGSSYAFVLPNGMEVPDPAARAQMKDVHGRSRLTEPRDYRWRVESWPGRPWHESIIYELHVGTFTEAGTFVAAAERLPHLTALGVTAIEIMPVAQFAGTRGWGYDGVLPYAVHSSYGTPEEFKSFIDAAHEHGLMVMLDVVYNHFGPEGNYLNLFAPDFFNPAQHTPWGAAIRYERQPVRQFFIENALFWLEEYMIDGLRLDAIDQIADSSQPCFLEELATLVHSRNPDRNIHLTTEDNRNITRLHERDAAGSVSLFTAEWNDDFHNAAHVIATGESEGYYIDFEEKRYEKLARALAEGFVYQGEYSTYLGRSRGEPSSHLPAVAFIDFLQNHDQTGNRALGERLVTLASSELVECLVAITLLSPSVPLIFMGEEWGETRPFLYFTDFGGDLAEQVRQGRRREFGAWSAFRGAEARRKIPDPNALETMISSRLDWSKVERAEGQRWLTLYRRLLQLRAERIVPHLRRTGATRGQVRAAGAGIVAVSWELDDARLHLDANLLGEVRPGPPTPNGEVIYARPHSIEDGEERKTALPAHSVCIRISR